MSLAPSEETATMGQLCSCDMISSPILQSCTSQPESPVPLAPCTTCGRRVASQEKKSVGSWFVAESASPLGGELSFTLVLYFTVTKAELQSVFHYRNVGKEGAALGKFRTS